jgi:hypothetical protein
VDLTQQAAGAATAGGSDTQIQYNNSGTIAGSGYWTFSSNKVQVLDQSALEWGTGVEVTQYYDYDQYLMNFYTTDVNSSNIENAMYAFSIDSGNAGALANQEVFEIGKGANCDAYANWVELFAVDEDGDVSIAGDLAVTGGITSATFYQANIAAAASGATNLTINAGLAGAGTITIGDSSTGKITTDNLVEMLGNVDLGDAVASDTLTITAKIDADVYLDDDTTNSPVLYLRDAGEATCAITKVNGATGNTTVTIAAASDIEIVAGNLAVGNGTPGTAAMDGEDFYVNGASEFDGAVQFDGAITTASTVTLGGDNTINDQIAVAFNANDEELAITGTATNMTAAAMQTITMAAQDSTKHILRLIQTPDADADNEFLLLEDNAGDDKFEIEEGGNTIWTLDAAAIVQIDGDTTANTSTGGVLDLNVQTATNNGKAATILVQSEEGATQAYGLWLDLNDDTSGGEETYDSIYVSNANGTASTVRGLVLANNLDDGIVATMGAAAQAIVIDAAATINTGTSGVIDCVTILSENGASFLNIEAESEADGAGELVHGIYVSIDDDADTGTNEVRGLTVAGDGTNGTGLQHCIVTSGANVDAGLYLQTGYLRVGTGSSATESLGDDDGYLEGTLEVDGKVYADAGVEIDNTLLMTATVEISNAELDGLQGSAKELVAAPGANQLLEFVSAMLILDYGTAAFTESADNMAIEYDNGSAVAASETIESTGFIDQGADTITRAIPVKDPIDAAADIVNKNLALINNGDGEFGAGGTTTMTVIITYRVHDTLGL